MMRRMGAIENYNSKEQTYCGIKENLKTSISLTLYYWDSSKSRGLERFLSNYEKFTLSTGIYTASGNARNALWKALDHLIINS